MQAQKREYLVRMSDAVVGHSHQAFSSAELVMGMSEELERYAERMGRMVLRLGDEAPAESRDALAAAILSAQRVKAAAAAARESSVLAVAMAMKCQRLAEAAQTKASLVHNGVLPSHVCADAVPLGHMLDRAAAEGDAHFVRQFGDF